MALPRPIVALDILHDGPSVRAEARRRKVNDPDRQKDVQRAARAYKSPQRKCYLWAKAHGSLIHSLRPGRQLRAELWRTPFCSRQNSRNCFGGSYPCVISMVTSDPRPPVFANPRTAINVFANNNLQAVQSNGYLRLLWYIDPSSRTVKLRWPKKFP